jgi:hypothetical protein
MNQDSENSENIKSIFSSIVPQILKSYPGHAGMF